MLYMTAPSPTGSRPRMIALMRPSAVSARTSRRNRSLAIMVSATVDSSSAKLPPTSRWIRTAMTAHAKSPLPRRSAISSSASSSTRPRRASASTRRSSRPMGSWTSWATASTPCISEYPARSDPAISWSMSGSWVWNFRRRCEARKFRTAIGPRAATSRTPIVTNRDLVTAAPSKVSTTTAPT